MPQPAPPLDLGFMFDAGPILAAIVDRRGRILRVSHALASLLGRSRAQMVGLRALGLMPRALRRTRLRGALPGLRTTGQIPDFSCDLTARDGRSVAVRLSATALPDGAGTLVILSDDRAARAAFDEAQTKAQEAQDASLAKSRFLAAMSHEIRTPLNAILGFAQLLDLSGLDDKRRGHVRAIMSASRSLMALLTDLLDLSQAEAGRLRIHRRAVDLHALVDEVAEWWSSSAADNGATLEVSIDPDLPAQILTDRGRVQQVLNNYLGNAVKFAGAARITLSVTPRQGPNGAALIRFAVADSGPGIPAADLARLFRPFVQVGPEETASGGWGLGLSICANIATAMGGAVGADSPPGEGARFWCDLPLDLPASAPAAQAPAPPAPRPDTPPQRALRILLAEDNALNQEMLGAMLTGMGHQVTTALNGFEAVSAASSRGFDVILMDVMMPGLDGVGATERIRALGGAAAEVPIVACSAHVAPEMQARYLARGMTAVLPKPVDRAALARLLRRLVPPDASPDTSGH